MSVENIILGLLEEPSTGYQIKRDFDEVFNNFWAAEQSQIYRTLKSLESRGLVRSRLEPSDRGPDRRVRKPARRRKKSAARFRGRQRGPRQARHSARGEHAFARQACRRWTRPTQRSRGPYHRPASPP